MELFRKINNYGFKKSLEFGMYEIYRYLYLRLVKKSFSLGGEDLIIDRLVSYKKSGFYVDVGANHPDRLSNTKRFFLKSWSGINIDANPQAIDLFKKDRPSDININTGVGGDSKEDGRSMDFFVMFPPTVSTFDEKMKNNNLSKGCEHIETIKVPVTSLSSVLSKYLPKGQLIDFMSIDIEGFDFSALKSNNWDLFRPNIICIESPTSFFDGDFKKETFLMSTYLNNVDYELVYHNGMDAFYKNRRGC